MNEYQDMMDIVFTSPPYFSVEKYSYDETQSWVRYKDINSWNELFLHNQSLGSALISPPVALRHELLCLGVVITSVCRTLPPLIFSLGSSLALPSRASKCAFMRNGRNA